jgi:hypothetical protein
MGFVMVLGTCWLCRRSFTFNPLTVPSYDPSRDDPSQRPGRQPICATCITSVNARRAANGLDPWPVSYDAYDSIPEAALGE